MTNLRSPHEAVTLVASAAQTEADTGTDEVELVLLGGVPLSSVQCILDVTVAATDATDELDVFVQTKLGAEWVDVIHFTQVLGNGGAKTYVAKVIRDVATAEFETGTSLGAAAVRNLLGRKWRCRWTLADGGDDNASFTFSVVAVPQ